MFSTIKKGLLSSYVKNMKRLISHTNFLVILMLSLNVTMSVCPRVFMCVTLDMMIVDKVLGAWAVNLSHIDRYAVCTPSRQRHLDAHAACACVSMGLWVCFCELVICSLGIPRIPKYALSTQTLICVSKWNTNVTDKILEYCNFYKWFCDFNFGFFTRFILKQRIWRNKRRLCA